MNKYNFENSKEYKEFKENEPITKELYINVFQGFYESIFCNPDQFIDIESEDKYILLDKYPFLNKNDFEVYYNFENFENYKNDISKEFSKLYLELIKELLPYDITENHNFLLELKSSYIDSPQYYNYRTDKNCIRLKTNYTTLNLIKDYVLSFENMKNYINNYNIEKYECNESSFLFDNIIIQNDKDLIFNLNYECYENIEVYNYVDPYVEYNYKTILLYEFEDMLKNYLKTLQYKFNVVL